jgi:Ni,Fe-hydrogenase III large subunit
MPASSWWAGGELLGGGVATRLHRLEGGQWTRAANDLWAGGARLLTMWARRDADERGVVRAALIGEAGVIILELAARSGAPYPGLQDIFPSASRMQRAIRDLEGFDAQDEDRRPWLEHRAEPYEFVRVEGDGVHEIAVGPVHAGIIEPGHFRFSVVGEKVLRLEERLGYVHKGIARRFETMPLLAAHRLAARVSGDSAAAFSWAYCQALEAALGARLPRRATWLRALALELERVQNHLGDLGALGNDAGFAFGLSQFSRLKEWLARAVHQCLGQRYLFDFIVPGGVAVDPSPERCASLATALEGIAAEVRELRVIYEEHSGVRDRFVGAGQVLPELAQRLGLTGLAARASGQPHDVRIDLKPPPYDELPPARCLRTSGDVAARVELRFEELLDSCRLIAQWLRDLPSGAAREALATPQPGLLALGLTEGWRGPVCVALETGAGGLVRRCHAHDPSWHNWPVLEHAIIGNIVPDFPLINKSFNLSYSGHDL